VPDPVRLFPVIDPQVSPNGTLSVRLTVSLKPFCAVIVIVDARLVPDSPDGEVADIVKSLTVKLAVAVSLRVPLAPVIVRA
jgi:hypothetical protein